MARVEKVPTSDFNPFYGCFIMIMAVLVFGGIIGWSAWSLFSQDKAIALFAEDQPRKFEPVELKPEERAALVRRLEEFASSAKGGQKAQLRLSVEDLNRLLVLAPDSGYGSYLDMVRFERIDPARSQVLGRVSLPMNHIKFWEDRKRYLNGEAGFLVFLHDKGVDVKVVDVKVPGKEVAAGFIDGMGLWTWLSPYQKMETIAQHLLLVKKVTLTPEAVVLESQP
jgi:hypothetical protein